MHASVRNLPLAVCLSLAAVQPSLADPSGVYLPSAPTGPGGEDSIETSSGTRCRQSMNSNGAYVDLGVVGNAASPAPRGAQSFIYDQRDRDATAYARVTIPLGSRPKRIDCDQVYQLEIERLKRELELMKMAAE